MLPAQPTRKTRVGWASEGKEMDSEPKTYRISPEGVDGIVWRRGAWGFVFMVLIAVLFVLVLGQSADQYHRQRLVIVGCFVVFVALIILPIAGKRLRTYWSSYRLSFGEDSILRLQEGLKPMRLHRGEITKVEEVRGTRLTLCTNARLQRLFIPADLSGYQEVRDAISKWRTPETLSLSARASRANRQVGLLLLCFGSWFLSARSRNTAVVVQSGLLFYGLVALGFSDLQRDPNVTSGAKVRAWFGLLFCWKLLIVPFLRMCSAFAK